jgi:hypothetical protein
MHPSAREAADGMDDDCDGTVDEGTEWYDDDGDGWAEAGGDCDDSDPFQAPGEDETCDGVDEDCDGTVDEGAPCLTTIYSQNFDSHAVFSESTVGSQTFTDSASWWDAGLFSYLRYASGHSSSYSMGIYKPYASGSAGNLQYIIPASATASEDLVVTFWAYASWVYPSS